MKTTEKTYEVKYTGYLMNSENMFLHYGYNNWSDVSEKKMRKLKSCYKIEVVVPASVSELNFCFRANENDWDNNCGNNWSYVPGEVANYESVEITEAVKSSASKTKAATKTTSKTTIKKVTTKKATIKK